MKYLRRVGLSLAVSILVVSLIGFALSVVTAKTVRNKETVKTWLQESGIYNQVTDSVLDQVRNRSQENLPANIDINNPEIKTIINEVFDQNLLKNVAEKLVDGTFAWLDGNVESPELAINLSEPKKQLADSLGLYAVQRVNSLPACTPLQLSAISMSSDPLSIQCRPPNVNAEQIRQEVTNNTIESLSFLPDNYTDTENTLANEAGNHEWSLAARDAYQKTAWLPYLFLGLILLSTVITVFISSTRKNGLFRAGGALLTSGVSLGIFSLLATRAPELLNKMFGRTADTNLDIASKLATVAAKDISSMMWWYVGLYLILGFAIVLLAKYLPALNPKPVNKK